MNESVLCTMDHPCGTATALSAQAINVCPTPVWAMLFGGCIGIGLGFAIASSVALYLAKVRT